MKNYEQESLLIAEFLKSDECAALIAQIPCYSFGIGENKAGQRVIRVSTSRQITSEDIRNHQKPYKGHPVILEFGGNKQLEAL